VTQGRHEPFDVGTSLDTVVLGDGGDTQGSGGGRFLHAGRSLTRPA
jgi:hypothetical protein